MANDHLIPIAQMRRFRRDTALYKTVDAWSEVLHEVPIPIIENLVGGLVELGATQQGLDASFVQMMQMKDESKNRLKHLLERGFKPEQIHLFIHSNTEERQELAQAWNRSFGDKLRDSATQTQSVTQTVTTVGMVGGAIGCLLFMGAGLAASDGSITETGRILLGILSDPPMGTDGSDLVRPSGESMMASGAAISLGASLLSLCLKSALAFANELLKDDPIAGLKATRRDLNDRILGEFSRTASEGFTTPKGTLAREHVEDELKTIPDAYLPLLTHFAPRELVTFLVANEEARDNMMQAHPPKSEQQIETVRALHSGKMRRAWETARQSLTAWEGAFARAPGLTLKSTMASLREARNARIAQANASIEPRLASPKLR